MSYGNELVPQPLGEPPSRSGGHAPISPAAVTLDFFQLTLPIIKCLESIYHTYKAEAQERKQKHHQRGVLEGKITQTL